MNFTGSMPPSRFKRHFEVTLGKMLQPAPASPKDISVPYLRAANIDWSGIRFDDIKEMWFSPSDFEKYLLKNGDLVVLEGGDVGRAAILSGIDSPLGFQNSVHRVRPHKGSDIDFAHFWLQHLKVSGYFDLICSKATLAHFTAEKFAEAPFPRIDLQTQKRIASFLGRETARIDGLVALREKFAEKVQEARQSLIVKLLVGLPEASEHKNSENWLANLSPDIAQERAKFHFRERTELSATGGEELLTVSHLTGLTKRSEKTVNMILAVSNAGYKIVKPGDLVINTMWAWMGAMGVSGEDGLISPAYGIYQPVSTALLPEYVDLLVRSKPFVAEATRRSKGIHSSRLRLYPDAFLDMRLPVPSRARQEEILKEIKSRSVREDSLIDRNSKATDLLREYRAALITAAVTGQIDVDTYGKAGETSKKLDQIEKEFQ